MNYRQTDKAREMRIEVAAGSASTGGKRGDYYRRKDFVN
jgi:hypothetical protein